MNNKGVEMIYVLRAALVEGNIAYAYADPDRCRVDW